MVKVIISGRKGIKETECERCGTLIEYDEFTDVKTDQIDKDFIYCPHCEIIIFVERTL